MVEKKEYRVPVIQTGDVLEFLDAEGNPFKPSSPLKYRILRKDGSLLSEGTIEDTNIVPFTGKKARDVEVIVDTYLTAEVKIATEESEEEASSEGSVEPEQLAMESERPAVSPGPSESFETSEEAEA